MTEAHAAYSPWDIKMTKKQKVKGGIMALQWQYAGKKIDIIK
jgi:hypothetical protein